MLAVLTGMLLGAWHVVSGPDHLAAVAPLAAHCGRPRASARVGLAWGLGHAGGVWLVGLLLLAIGSALPLDALGRWSEIVVGLALLGVGAWGLWRARRGESGNPGHRHESAPRAARSAMAIGLVHGLAGGSHLYGVLPALALVGHERLGYLAGFGVASILAMGASALVMGVIVGRSSGSALILRDRALWIASLAAMVVGAMWLLDAA